MKTAIVHARIEPGMKRTAEGVLKKLGVSPTEAIRMFYRQITLGLILILAVGLDAWSRRTER